MSTKTAEELAAETAEPGTFSFIDRLRGRNYAKDTVIIYLDEQLGYELNELVSELKTSDSLNATTITKLETDIANKIEELKPQAYTLELHGISNKEYNELVDQAAEKYPYEYDENQDILGRKEKTLIESEDRQEFFTGLLWLACITSITDANGSVADDINAELVAELRVSAPLAVIHRINDTVNKLRLATDWIEYTQDEDFSVKP